MEKFFSDYGRLERWIRVERAFIKFMLLRRNMSKEDVAGILKKCDMTPYEVLKDLAELDEGYEHFKRSFIARSPVLKDAEFEYGLDYVGICRVSDALLMRDWNCIIFGKLKDIKEVLKDLAFKYKKLVQIGRTHGIHGEPTSFGYRFAVMYSDIDRYIHSIFDNRKYVESIAFDNEGFLDPSICEDLKLFLSGELDLFFGVGNSFHITGGCYFNAMTILNGMAQTIGKHVLDLTLLGAKDIGEIKVSGEVYEKMVAVELLAREIDGNTNFYAGLGNGVNVDRKEFYRRRMKVVYDVLKGVEKMVDIFGFILRNIEPDIGAIEKNLSRADESIYSQKILLYLITKSNNTREVISEELKKLTANSKSNLKSLLVTSSYGKYLSDDILEKLFDKDSFLKNIDDLYSRIFGNDLKSRALKKILWDENEINYEIDKLANKLNREYGGSKVPITVVAFSERALVFAGNLLSKLDFPLVFKSIPHAREDLEIKSISFDRNLVDAKRILILDFLVHPESNLDHFMDKLSEVGTPLDFRICSMLKFSNVTDDNFVVNWFAFECKPDDFYAGFGKNCGSSDFFRHLPVIGLAA